MQVWHFRMVSTLLMAPPPTHLHYEWKFAQRIKWIWFHKGLVIRLWNIKYMMRENMPQLFNLVSRKLVASHAHTRTCMHSLSFFIWLQRYMRADTALILPCTNMSKGCDISLSTFCLLHNKLVPRQCKSHS